jgi:hypothetical protein
MIIRVGFINIERSDNMFTSTQIIMSHRKLCSVIYAFLCVSLLGFSSVSTKAFADELADYDLKMEALGGIRVGDRFKQVQDRLGKAKSASKTMYDSRNQCEKQVLYYANDLEVEFCGSGPSRYVHSIRVVKNDRVSTLKGAKTGMNLELVKKIYRVSKVIGNHTLIVQDLRSHLRLRFLIADQKVYEISLYKEVTGNKVKSRKKKKWNF